MRSSGAVLVALGCLAALAPLLVALERIGAPERLVLGVALAVAILLPLIAAVIGRSMAPAAFFGLAWSMPRGRLALMRAGLALGLVAVLAGGSALALPVIAFSGALALLVVVSLSGGPHAPGPSPGATLRAAGVGPLTASAVALIGAALAIGAAWLLFGRALADLAPVFGVEAAALRAPAAAAMALAAILGGARATGFAALSLAALAGAALVVGVLAYGFGPAGFALPLDPEAAESLALRERLALWLPASDLADLVAGLPGPPPAPWGTVAGLALGLAGLLTLAGIEPGARRTQGGGFGLRAALLLAAGAAAILALDLNAVRALSEILVGYAPDSPLPFVVDGRFAAMITACGAPLADAEALASACAGRGAIPAEALSLATDFPEQGRFLASGLPMAVDAPFRLALAALPLPLAGLLAVKAASAIGHDLLDALRRRPPIASVRLAEARLVAIAILAGFALAPSPSALTGIDPGRLWSALLAASAALALPPAALGQFVRGRGAPYAAALLGGLGGLAGGRLAGLPLDLCGLFGALCAVSAALVALAVVSARPGQPRRDAPPDGPSASEAESSRPAR
jgi:hypothetical protein